MKKVIYSSVALAAIVAVAACSSPTAPTILANGNRMVSRKPVLANSDTLIRGIPVPIISTEASSISSAGPLLQ